MTNLIQKAATDIIAARKLTILTGAGISVESGIPAFRGKGGVWEKIDPMEYAHIDALRNDPEKVWKVLIREMNETVSEARPNAAHRGLVRLERLKKSATIITQNIDGLHQRAGSTDVIEFHGTFAWQRCMTCNNRYETHTVDMGRIPPLCACGGMLRPDVVFFGEMIPYRAMARSEQAAKACDLMLVVGTSAVVEPAASMPVTAKNNGARIIEINPEPSPLTGRISDYIVLEKAGKAMEAIVAEMERQLGAAPSGIDPPEEV